MGESSGYDLLAKLRDNVLAESQKTDGLQPLLKMTAREKIAFLLDLNSFVEIDAFVRQSYAMEGFKEVSALGEGVVSGYGTIDGRGVYIFSQDSSVLGGSIGVMHAKKILKTLELAGKTGLPVIAILDSSGVRLGEGAGSLESLGSIYKKMSELSGVVPVFCIIGGRCIGSAAFFAPLSDFVFVTRNVSCLCTAPPATFGQFGKEFDAESIGNASSLIEKSGVAHFLNGTEEETFLLLKQLISFLPDNNLVDAPDTDCADDLNREISIDSEGFDTRQFISSVMDDGYFFEVQRPFASHLITGFARINGRTLGIIANEKGTCLDIAALEKAGRFISFCDAYSLPLVTFVDTPGLVKDLDQEQTRLMISGARLIDAYASASVSMICVIIGQAIGFGYLAMSPKSLGADMVYAWPDAEISCLPGDAAALVLNSADVISSEDTAEARKEAAKLYQDSMASPIEAAKMGYVDEVIYPSETRQRIAGALEMVIGKRENRLPKKHGTKTF